MFNVFDYEGESDVAAGAKSGLQLTGTAGRGQQPDKDDGNDPEQQHHPENYARGTRRGRATVWTRR